VEFSLGVAVTFEGFGGVQYLYFILVLVLVLVLGVKLFKSLNVISRFSVMIVCVLVGDDGGFNSARVLNGV